MRPAEPTPARPLEPVRTLLSRVIDYAGLFPPAGLGMQQAAENFARYHRGEHAWMLGRFICPASRLEEFSSAAAVLMPGTFGTSGYREHAEAGEPWGVSAVIDGELGRGLEQVARFNERHAREDAGLAVVDAVEVRAPDAAFIDAALDLIPDEIYPFFELPGQTPGENADPRGLIAALSGAGAAAKIRTGGVTPEAFPTPEQLATFLHACHAADVPFKATAGLHHPLRAEYPLTYEPGCPKGTMHGFLNLFIAAILVREAELEYPATVAVLRETLPAAMRFEEAAIAYRDTPVTTIDIAQGRESFALSFGSCSFDEPVEELRGLELL